MIFFFYVSMAAGNIIIIHALRNCSDDDSNTIVS